jgi:hypothetical protein
LIAKTFNHLWGPIRSVPRVTGRVPPKIREVPSKFFPGPSSDKPAPLRRDLGDLCACPCTVPIPLSWRQPPQGPSGEPLHL